MSSPLASESRTLKKRQLPKLMACMTKSSLENMRNKALFCLDVLDAKGIRRRKQPLHECLILEMREAGFSESSDYLQDILYDNVQLVNEDDIGIVVDLRTREDYLEHISAMLVKAEKLRDNVPGADTEEPFQILTEVRDTAIGKSWPLYEPSEENPKEEVPPDTLFQATAIQLHRVLIGQARQIRSKDPGKAERLSRLAERRAKDAIIEIGICQLDMNNLNNAQKTFERAFKIHSESNNIEGLCDSRMHMAAVMQRMGDHEAAAQLLTEMGAMAMEYGLRRHLGRALHLLGELHLRRERPELGTQHLQEAFFCFMGSTRTWQDHPTAAQAKSKVMSTLDVIYKADKKEVYEEEAEQARLMMAISAGDYY
ncbi:hypothetical protein MSG28_001688 [Choristoneura fumiferana]|uniref:Uncharacterized protein n=1 Tax=Choristoneura fumiferana TaxID=7141 RepID=A0ACC0KVM4_CHOFU|nr:hypothetical protein MSG28_001688 [Choristoneura fumiferana]